MLNWFSKKIQNDSNDVIIANFTKWSNLLESLHKQSYWCAYSVYVVHTLIENKILLWQPYCFLALLVKPAELLLSLCVCPSVTHFTQKVLIGSSPNLTNGTRAWIARDVVQSSWNSVQIFLPVYILILCFTLIKNPIWPIWQPFWFPQKNNCDDFSSRTTSGSNIRFST